jgi:hypothetical protein
MWKRKSSNIYRDPQEEVFHSSNAYGVYENITFPLFYLSEREVIAAKVVTVETMTIGVRFVDFLTLINVRKLGNII